MHVKIHFTSIFVRVVIQTGERLVATSYEYFYATALVVIYDCPTCAWLK